MNNNIKINGPINVVRLENKDDNKILYLFMDIHNEVKEQTECDEINAIDIRNLFIDKLSKTTITLDCFFESFSSNTEGQSMGYVYKKRYIDEVNRIFNKEFKFNKETKKIDKSLNFPNIRIHYMDYRNWFDFFYIFDTLNDIISLFNHMLMKLFLDKKVLTSIIKNLEHLLKTIDYIDSYTNVNIDITNIYSKTNLTTKDKQQIKDYLIYKLHKIYKNENINQLIINLINIELNPRKDKLKQLIQQLIYQITELLNIDILFDYPNELNLNIDEKINIDNLPNILINMYNTQSSIIVRYHLCSYLEMMDLIKLMYINYSSILTDLFFLRRFLDNEYIKNGVVYTGYIHSIFYIYTLVKYKNYKITNISYIRNDKTIDDINNDIKKMEIFEELIVYIIPPHKIQCSDISEFPELFR